MSEKLPAMDMGDNPTGCCPRFHPEAWDGKEFDFADLRFVSVRTRSFLYMPLNMGSVMRKAQAAVEAAGAAPKDRYFMLSRDETPWRATHRLLVTKDVPGMETVTLTGRWLAKVFEGSFSQTGAWYREMAELAAERGAGEAELLAFYTTCPNCAKTYGKNYVVLFARVG